MRPHSDLIFSVYQLFKIFKTFFKLLIFSVVSSVNLNESLTLISALKEGIKVGFEIEETVFGRKLAVHNRLSEGVLCCRRERR